MALKGNKPILYDSMFLDIIGVKKDSPEKRFFRALLHRVALDYLFCKHDSKDWRSANLFLFNERFYDKDDITLSYTCEAIEIDKNSFLKRLVKEKVSLAISNQRGRCTRRYIN